MYVASTGTMVVRIIGIDDILGGYFAVEHLVSKFPTATGYCDFVIIYDVVLLDGYELK